MRFMVGANFRTPASDLGVIDSNYLKRTDSIKVFVKISTPQLLKIGA